jgi:hypothetical protein
MVRSRYHCGSGTKQRGWCGELPSRPIRHVSGFGVEIVEPVEAFWSTDEERSSQAIRQHWSDNLGPEFLSNVSGFVDDGEI